jgi:uncharacterized damage-inducible protein DinB
VYQANLSLLKSTRVQTLAMTADLSEEQAAARPAPDQWSVSEVLEHLLISERLYRDMIARLIQLKREGKRPVIIQSLTDINTGLPFVPRALMPFMDIPLTFMNLFIPDFVREQMMQVRSVKAKSPTVAQPKSGKSLAQLRQELSEAIGATEALLEQNADIDFRSLRHYHPVIGFNHVLQILRIVAIHERRHQGQITEILSTNRAQAA